MTGHFVEHMEGGVGGRMEICLVFQYCQLKKPNLRTAQKSRPCTANWYLRVRHQTSTQNNKLKTYILFWGDRMNAAPDTDKQTNLIRPNILYISTGLSFVNQSQGSFECSALL
jgi:hypothetical protein